MVGVAVVGGIWATALASCGDGATSPDAANAAFMIAMVESIKPRDAIEAMLRKPDNSIKRCYELLASRKVDGIVSAGKNSLAHTAGAQAAVQVDPAQTRASLPLFTQHAAQCEVAPGRVHTAVKNALRVRVLPA